MKQKKVKLNENVKIDFQVERGGENDIQVNRNVYVRLPRIEAKADLSDKWYDVLFETSKEHREQIRNILEEQGGVLQNRLRERINNIETVHQALIQGLVHDAAAELDQLFEQIKQKFPKSGEEK